MHAVRLVKYRGWSMRKVARYFGVEASTVSRWCQRDKFGGWYQIATKSAAPKHHPNALPRDVVSAIVERRKSSKRCGQVIHRMLLREGVKVSLASVQRTLSRHHMLKKRSPWKRPHDATKRPDVAMPGDLVQIDTIHTIDAHGGRVYMYTLIDLKSRWAYAEVSAKIGTRESVRFVASAQAEATFPFKMVQSDHGSEFSKMFTFRLARMGMAHRHSRVRQSNDNAHIERFNRTIQEECTDKVPKALKRFRDVVPSYLKHYNTKRLHMGINYQTPLEVLRRC